MNHPKSMKTQVSAAEYQILQQLRERKPARTRRPQPLSVGDRLADKVATVMGSWRFIILQSIVLILWVILNSIALIQRWDPYPFILLNLMLSFQAAYAAPIIMMSQNRQAAIDRAEAKHDYEINQKAELELEVLQDKINLLQEKNIAEIRTLLIEQKKQLDHLESLLKSND